MSAVLLEELARLGISLARNGDHLLVEGPERVVTDELIDAIRASKPSLLAVLGGEPVADPATTAERCQSIEREGGDALLSPWRCFACRGQERRRRERWGDWTCGTCGVIVAGPEETERPLRLVRRYGPEPLPERPAVCWGRERGYLAVSDPRTGEWHEIPYREAPGAWQAAVRRRRGTGEERR